MSRRVSLAIAAALLGGCGNGHEPSPTVSSLSLAVYTTEWEPQRRHIMVLGEQGSMDIRTETMDGCVFQSPCPVSADVQVGSSNPSVVSLDRRTVETPSTLELRAHAAGTATITARVGNLSKSERVDVVEAPLPLDDLQVTLATGWNDLPTQYDASGNLTWMSVPAGQTGALIITTLRDGTRVLMIPLTVASSAPSIALGTAGCRPPSMDPHCDTFSDGWVVGVSPGDAEVTVTGRNITKHFTAHVDP